ncbi:PX-associated-domain-containing protein [Pseudomassariella vexata]|uniref:PX-associated-domain-containing protein n=1 Tax=Pseudomassariella vexata TaxID=1141098 RepID=A0A1Y2DIE0_9PEZI|nr:PX-associated-domain-containing protein [Pseudomassariella vexata]ORY58575.1 PX-associated-domain-containing protein [Pseudomassariella vexata]
MPSKTLTSTQLRALFDILTHYETYREVVSFRDPAAISKYGYPFDKEPDKDVPQVDGAETSFPLLQLLLTSIILPVPVVRVIPRDFWNVHLQGIMARFAQVELSESYDKSGLGTRKTLATAASVIHESITRGILGGVSERGRRGFQEYYDATTAEGVIAAWDDAIHELTHGNLIDELFDHVTASTNFEDHSPAVKTAVDYAIVHIATLLHQVLVVSPKGQYMRRLLESTHKVIPYSVVGQTLRVGNAATMMSAMLRLLLGKVSIGGFTNWMGITQNAADGSNLLQKIISVVLDWDAGDFRKAVEKIKKSKNGASNDHLAALDDHLQATRDQHDLIRAQSIKQQESIVVSILKSRDPALTKDFTEAQHTQCLEYYAAKLAVRDREKIIEVLCQSSPDYFTSMIKEGMTAIDPLIRNIHANMDLRRYLGDAQKFLDDLIQTSKPKEAENPKKDAAIPPSVEDYVALLRRNRQLLFDWLHDIAKDCPDIRDDFRGWAKETIKIFRADTTPEDPSKEKDEHTVRSDKTHRDDTSASGAGAISGNLESIFSDLSPDTREAVLTALDAHAEYLASLDALSKMRMQQILNRSEKAFDQSTGKASSSNSESGSMSGPGTYLLRWQSLLDEALITTATMSGPPRRGKEVAEVKTWDKKEKITVEPKGSWDSDAIATMEARSVPEAPDVGVVTEALGKPFKDIVADVSSRGIRNSPVGP